MAQSIQYRTLADPGWTLRQAAHYASCMSHPRPFYYLENFCTALAWLRQRYGDLLNETEQGFIERFQGLPLEASALLVRMIGRRGDLFRTAKLRYAEIGCIRAAATPLIELGWVDCQPLLTVAELGRLLRSAARFQRRHPAAAARRSQSRTAVEH
jgi:hypothetical protein